MKSIVSPNKTRSKCRAREEEGAEIKVVAREEEGL
jgi:hypothetical protein